MEFGVNIAASDVVELSGPAQNLSICCLWGFTSV